MMTRKDFTLIAKVVAEFEPPFSPCNEFISDDIHQTEDTREALAHRFANVLKYENPNFDRERFMAACGVE